jgi:hypothetical protein
MRRLLVVVAIAGCGGSDTHAVPPKAPNNELILGTFERHPPDGSTAFRFRADGSITLAHDKGELDSKPLAAGTWQVDKTQLTLTYDSGMCKGNGPGVYTVVISKRGLHLTKVSDACDQRAKLDGETLWRVN